ncbi:MAG: AAA family ATPase [Armatimonadetes bacterium]|nr:AAA family ATPase [Armatimonadota bacterium]
MPDSYPLILGIHGPSGEGKTFQCEAICRQYGIEIFAISVGELESSDAGEPIRFLQRTYERASRAYSSPVIPAAVLVIHDIDAAIGDWGEKVAYTEHRQLLSGEFMRLADDPYHIDGKECNRVPIIFTGNDFTRLYEPLRRTGRMAFFEWRPSHEDKKCIVKDIFRFDSPLESSVLVDTFPDEPVAFFAHLGVILDDDFVYQQIQSVGFDVVASNFKQNRMTVPDMSHKLEDVIALGISILKGSRVISYLK